MKKPKAIIFDLEGVIIDSEPIWDEADAEFLRTKGIKYESDRTKHLVMGKNLVEGAKIFKDLYKFSGSPVDLAQERRNIAKECFKRDVQFIHGFKGFYERVAKHLSIGVATSLERDFLNAIDSRLSLSKMFNGHIYSIEDIGFVSKPNPDIFLYAANKIGVNPEDAIVIEDAPNGVEAAHAAGMKVIGLTTSTSRERLSQADSIVDTYGQIKL